MGSVNYTGNNTRKDTGDMRKKSSEKGSNMGMGDKSFSLPQLNKNYLRIESQEPITG